MIELIRKYKDLGTTPESLLLIDKYESIFNRLNLLIKYSKNDKCK